VTETPAQPGLGRRRRGWWARWGITILGFVVLALTGFTAVLNIQQGLLTRQVADEGRGLARQVNQTQTQVLCPLLGLFLASYHPELQPPANRDFYEHAFSEIRRMNSVLRCTRT